MKKLISLLLVLLLLCSLLPMSAMADDEVKHYIKNDKDGKWYELVDGKVGAEVVDKELIAALDKRFNEYLAWLAEQPPVHTNPNDHKLGWNSNLKYHWKECACGARFEEEPHMDPLDTENDTCICGYHFSDNADLVTLWIKGCPPIKGFDKNKTEYTLDAYTYKDVKEIKISTRSFDVGATVELPEDLTLKDGENKFEIKVIAENRKVTKVYTVIINKEPKK